MMLQANGKTVTILEDVLTALESQISLAEASPSEQQPGNTLDTAIPAQATEDDVPDADSPEQGTAASQHKRSALSPEDAHPKSGPVEAAQRQAASNAPTLLPEPTPVQASNSATCAADPSAEPVIVSSNPVFEPANAVPSETAANDASLTELSYNTMAQPTEMDAAAVSPSIVDAGAQINAAEPIVLPLLNHLQPNTISNVSPGAALMAAEPAAAAVKATASETDSAAILVDGMPREPVGTTGNDGIANCPNSCHCPAGSSEIAEGMIVDMTTHAEHDRTQTESQRISCW